MSRLAGSSIVLASLLATMACGKEPAPAAAAGAGAFPPTEVKTVTLAMKPVAESSEYVATVRSLRSTTIQPQVEGLVTQIFVKAGDRVRAGQPLLQIDPDKQQAAVTSMQSQRASREADLAYAKQQLARLQKLYDAGAVSQAELEQAETAEKNAEAQLATVAAQIRETQVQLQYYRVTAPTAGVVGDIPIRQGDRVTPSTIITTIDEPEGLEAYINVPLERAGDLREGLMVELIDSQGQVIATNPITFVAPRADDATQSVLAKATLRQMPPTIRVMQYVRARVIWKNDPALTVPVTAVNRLAGQYFIFTVEKGQQGTVARQKPVMLGTVINDEYIVRSGLKEGEQVIVSNIQKIGDGAPVKAS